MGEGGLQLLVLEDGGRLETGRRRAAGHPGLDVEDPAALVVEGRDRAQLQAIDGRQQSRQPLQPGGLGVRLRIRRSASTKSSPARARTAAWNWR